MSPPSPAADAVAHRLLAGAVAPARVLDTMGETLARWFGPYGYHALLTRALVQARAAHPALAAVRVRAPLTPVLDGLPDAAHAHGGPAVTAGVAAVIAGVADLLGRVIGDDMTRHLLEPPMDRATRDDPPSLSPPADARGVTLDRSAEGAS
ncbi:hypothetical protein tb265_07000 [Gemmatimonadetes bacterium T265]|nr:hypothetical protein tb265_07000 [Gemmatimonadetes bacterium T265]